MQIELVNKTAKTITFKILDEGKYFLENEVEIVLNKKMIGREKKKTVTLQNLNPDTVYSVYVQRDNVSSNILELKTEYASCVINIKELGAVGDLKTDNTNLIQTAINIAPKNSIIEISDGDYLTGPIFLKSDITLDIKKNASLVGKENREDYPILPCEIKTLENEKMYIGSWEGEPQECFASLITVINAENVNIIGEGTLNGNAKYDTWWKDAKVKRLAWRPRTLYIANSENINVEGLNVKNSPSWTIHPILSKNIKFLNLYIENPKDSPNTDGLDPESCENVEILGVKFSVGDDCIAIKSGKGEIGRKINVPSKNIKIEDCYMEFGHGAVVIGSEMSGGIKDITIKNCIFRETDRGIRLKTRRGRGGVVEGINIENVHMNKVLTPLVINCFYFCDIDGKTEKVWSKEKFEVTEETPKIKDIFISNVDCVDSEVCAGFVYGLPETKIENINIENFKVSFSDDAKEDFPAMMSFIEKSKRNGFYFNNVKDLKLKNIELKNCIGEEILKFNIE